MSATHQATAENKMVYTIRKDIESEFEAIKLLQTIV
jgi:hypothetical protein